jgi:metal-dependent amidase/aminoacylase/carboxypeptidase family protein
MSSVQEVLVGYDGLQAFQEAFYRDLHQHPELSHQEQRTARRVARLLQDCGCTVQAGIGGTGVVGMLSNGEGPTVLLRADMDALPVKRGHRRGLREHRDRRRRRRQRGTGGPRLRP